LLSDEYGEALGEQGRDYAQRIADSAERQGLLLSDLLKHLSLSRADLPLEKVELPRIINQARADLVLEVEQKKALIHVGSIAERVWANPSSLHTIVFNLLSNALKFVAPGVRPEVRILTELRQMDTTAEAPSGTNQVVRLWVEDNGLGIPPELLGKLFGVFQRLHTGPQYPGTGIGLAVVKKAAERMGGRVGVESKPGKGSRFWVELKAVT
jgi:signal transduction histidine kinase